MEAKIRLLRQIIKEMESILIAYSGGVDSALLLKMAAEELGEKKVLAVTASSATYPHKEVEAARRIAKSLGVEHHIINTDELSNPDFVNNSPQRCYYCKQELFEKLSKLAQHHGIKYVVDGTNADDEMDFRPGTEAALEYHIRSPLKEAGLTKSEIRKLSYEKNLPTWDKPSLACLASRFPYGVKIETHSLKQVEEAESFLRKKGFKEVRVRHHQEVARIEVGEEELQKFNSSNLRSEVNEKLKELGYVYVALDLQGYRTGSMNAVLKQHTANAEEQAASQKKSVRHPKLEAKGEIK